MKKKTNKKKGVRKTKLSFGDDYMAFGGAVQRGKDGMVRHYIQTPDEAITEGQIAIAKAREKGENNGWAKGIDIVGNMAIQYGSSQMGGAAGAGAGVAVGATQYAANGGRVGTKNVEIEGQEVVETPDGQVAEAKGPSHENGGINIDLPEGTEIFSKRIKVAGKNMADRKKARVKKELTLQKLLDKNSGDKVLKDSLKRTKNNNKIEEAKDQRLQELINQMQKTAGEVYAYGTGKKGVGGTPSYAFGTGPFGMMIDEFGNPIFNPQAQTNTQGIHNEFSHGSGYRTMEDNNPNRKVTGDEIQNMPDIFAHRDGAQPVQENFYDGAKMFGGRDVQTVSTLTPREAQPLDVDTTPTADMSGLKSLGTSNEGGDEATGGGFGNFMKGAGSGDAGFTGGDAVGLAGTLYSAFAPGKNTESARAGDTPNINAFRDFGNDALDSLENAQGYIDGQRKKALLDIEKRRTRGVQANRKTARGVNTLRTLDLAADVNANDASGDVYDNFSKQMMQMLTTQAGFENQQDQAVMQGEQNRDLADRQDRDNYYTQRAQDIATKGEGIQQTGKMMNQIKHNNASEKAVNSLSEHGYTWDNGVIVDKNGTPATPAEQEKFAKAQGYKSFAAWRDDNIKKGE